MKIQITCFFFIILSIVREVALSFRSSHQLSLAFVIACMLPMSALNGGIFLWVFNAISNLMQTLEDRQQTEKLNIFKQLWRILIFSLIIACCSIVFQIFD